MSLQGQLCDMSFHDLFDVLTKDSQQGRLNLEKGHYRAQLFVEKGEPYAARVLRVSGQHQEIWLRGEEAVHHMSAWEEGQFSFEHQAILPTARNIFIDKRELMLANIFKQDLYSQLQPDSTPTRRPAFDFAALSRQYVHALPGYRSRASQLDLNVTDWAILIQVDGAVSITQMAQAAHLSPEVTWHGVSKMVKLGLLALYQPASLVTLPLPLLPPAIIPLPTRSIGLRPPMPTGHILVEWRL